METAIHEPTEADILEQFVAPGRPTLAEPFARVILDLRFSEEAIARMNELVEKNRKGQLTEGEQSELAKYQRMGNFLNLIQAKARLSLV